MEFGYWAFTQVLKGLGFIGSRFSLKNKAKFGEKIGDLLRIVAPKRQKLCIDNLTKAFPNKSAVEIKTIMVNSFRNLGITLAELTSFPYMKESDFRDLVKYPNIEILKEAYSRGKGLILLSGHFGNWEALAYTAGLFSESDITVIVKHQRNFMADALLNKYRTQGGNKIVDMGASARVIVKCLTTGKAVALLADQSATEDKDLYIDFFGRPAATYKSPAELALKFKSPIIMGFAMRNPDYTYTVNLIELKTDDLNSDAQGIEELTRRHTKVLENAIIQRPELWAWQHNKWKHADKAPNISKTSV